MSDVAILRMNDRSIYIVFFPESWSIADTTQLYNHPERGILATPAGR